ncbi:MAG: Ig-like domain-containing protein [Anaerolineaceae bacterium]
MYQKTCTRILSVIIALSLVLAFFSPGTVEAKNLEPQSIATVEQQVLDEIQSNGSTSFWVDFKSKVDLSKADQLNWSERGWFVYETLKNTAEASQKQAISVLDGAAVKYKSYWIKNTILVESAGINVLNSLTSLSGVEAVRGRKTYILYEPDKSEAVLDYGLNAIEPNLTHVNADDAWAAGYDGTGLVVANVDTGVRYTHQALVGQYRGNNGDGTFDHNYNWFNPDSASDVVPRDGNGHGTHTMGTTVGDDGSSNQIGIAPGAEWIACAGCPDGNCTDSALLGCGEWIAAPTNLAGTSPDPTKRPNVVNNSWGDCGQAYDPWYEDVINGWQAAGIYPVFSNGNSSNCGYSSPPGLNTVGNPARSGNVTGVGSSGEQNGLYATHSNWGPTDNLDTVNPTDGFNMLKPQVLAPGVSIRSSVPTSDTSYEDGWSGTSMSAPHVTGLVALVWQAAPCMVGDYAATENLIEATATDMTYDDGSTLTPTNFPNFATGWGEIDALAAVTAAASVCGDSTLTGTVTDSATATPLVGVTVELTGLDPANNRTVYTNASGVFSAAVYADTYDLTASVYGYTSSTVTGVVVAQYATVTQDFALQQLPTGIVSGVVYDGGVEGGSSHGYPLYAKLAFIVPELTQTVYTDPLTGEYSVELYLGQEYTVSVEAIPAGYNTLSTTLTPLADPETQDFYLTVPQSVCTAPGYAQDYDFFWNFETDASGFTPGGTTSFAWGDFTNGPKAGHSGTKGIATNPSGNYSASELGYMLSPVIDLSSFGADTPAIQWWDWKHIESVSYDWARLDVTKDGGTTWTPVWGPVGGVSDTAYHQRTVALDPTYNVSNFQFRFYFKSDTSVQYEGWYIDDVGIMEVPIPPPTTVFTSDFESDNAGFTVSIKDDTITEAPPTWAWGAPSATPGPGAAHSGTNLWATNLTGSYSALERSLLTSPIIDLSANAGLAPTISFWHWMDSESINYDWGAVEVSKDGGTTWTTAWEKFGDVLTWTKKSLTLDSSYAVSNFQFRFYLRTDSSGQYPGWYIDDVSVSVTEPVEIAAPCLAVPGGVVAGYVYDEITSLPLTGASVLSDTGLETTTFAIPADPIEGFYWMFQPTATNPEDADFTASMESYGDDTKTVSVAQDEIVQQDFYLGTGKLTFDPLAFEVTMAMDDAPVEQTLTVGNEGTADASFELFEKDLGYTPLISANSTTQRISMQTGKVGLDSAGQKIGPTKQVIGSNYPNADVELILDDGSAENNIGIGGAAQFIFLNRFTPPSESYPFTLNEVQVYFDDTVAVGDELLLAIYENTSGNADPAVGSNLLATYPISVESMSAWNIYTLPEGVMLSGPGDVLIGVIALELPGSTYFPAAIDQTTTNQRSWAGWWTTPTAPAVPVLPPDESWTLIDAYFPGNWLVRGMGSAGGGDVVWLSESPVSGTVVPDGLVPVTLTIDPSTLLQPGDYEASLIVQEDTPYDYPEIPVTLHLLRPETWGTLKGTVSVLEACDVNPVPVEGATVNIYDELGVLLNSQATLADGSYSWSLLAGTYSVEVVFDGYETALMEGLVLPANADLVTDVALRLLAPCMSVDPLSMEKWVGQNLTTTDILTLINSGAAEAAFELVELPMAAPLADQLILDPSFEAYTPNPYWEEFSETYGTPLCTEADCGTGTGTGPNTGDVWAWFGGAAAGDTGYVSQAVEILPGTAKINFFVEQYVCGAAGTSNYMALVIDDVEVWRTDGTDDACAVLGYRPIEVDVSDFANGGTHTIAFESVTVDGANFFLDDVTLSLEAGGDITWLFEEPISGTVPAGSQLEVTVTFDATGLSLGDYYARLNVKNPPAETIGVPVTMHVVTAIEAFDQAVTTIEDIPVDITLEAIDPESDPLTYVIVDGPTHGTLEFTALPDLTYLPNADYYGEDSFTFKATDGTSDSNVATVTITVTSVNFAPLAVDDFYETDEGVELVVAAPGVLANDGDADPLDILKADLVMPPAHGTLNLLEDGSFTYMPDEGFVGEDCFIYDMLAIPPEWLTGMYSDEAEVCIMVNTAPVTYDQQLTTPEDTELPITLTADFTTPGPVVWTLITNPPNGTLSGVAPDLIYTPNQNWYGTDSFAFSVNDGIVESNIATITIVVTPVNDGPEAVDDHYVTAFNTLLTVAAPGVLENDFDADPTDNILADQKTPPLHGSLVLNRDGSFTYQPDAGYFGVDTFEYFMLATPSLTSELTDWATVTIVVKPAQQIFLPIVIR